MSIIAGTLILMIPVRNGFVIAADSRTSNDNQTKYCDESHKLIEITAGPPRTVAATTGINGLREPSDKEDFCQHLREATVWIDVNAELKNFIESRNDTAETLSLAEFEPRLRAAFASAPAAAAPYLSPLAGKTLCRLFVVSFDPEHSATWFRYAMVSLTPDMEIVVSDETVMRFGPDNDKTFWRLGEQDYLDDLMQRGKIAPHIKHRKTISFLNSVSKVQNVSKDRAIEVCSDVLAAVGEVAKTIKPPTAIGGPTDILFVGAPERPERVRWKG